MNPRLLSDAVQDYIFGLAGEDPGKIALASSPFAGITSAELAGQVAGRQKVRLKLPTWYATRGIYYPPGLNLEQASSERTARYKAGLVSGDRLIDLTCGLGVDTASFSGRFGSVNAFEQDAGLAEITRHNLAVLKVANTRVHAGDSLGGLNPAREQADWIYADPSRRHAVKGRVIRLEDYGPDLPANLPLLFRVAPRILVKTAPMLDITAGRRSLDRIRTVHVVSVANDVKELLWELGPDAGDEPEIRVVDLSRDDWPEFRFRPAEESGLTCPEGPLSGYLYEPSAAMLKAGAFHLAGVRFGLTKAHRHTHLYGSPECLAFPGRRFRIVDSQPYKPGKLPYRDGHVNVRNFPESVDTLRKRNRIKSGGDRYLFFYRDWNEQLRVIAALPV